MAKKRKRNRVVFRRDRVKRIINFIECLTCPSGVGEGKSFKLLPFQRRFIRDVYGPHVLSLRQVRRAILSLGRKNGKSTFLAALVLVHLCGPEAIPNGEIYTAANERDQAALIFKIAVQIVRASPILQLEVRIIESTHRIVHYKSGSFYRALSAEAGTKYGLNPTLVIYDELAQAKTRALYDALDTSMGARAEPLFIIISTQSADPEHLLSQLIDDGIKSLDPTIVAHLYETPDDADIYDPKSWKASNPALGKFRSWGDLRALADKAKRMPILEAAFRNLYLNQRVDAQGAFIPRPEWIACRGTEGLIPGEKIFLGLDLSATTDLCALAAVSVDAGDRVDAWFWKPKGCLDEHERRDRVPYKTWVDQGYIEAPEGRSIDYSFVAKAIGELCTEYEVVGMAYDRWRIENLLREFSIIDVEAYVEEKDAVRTEALRLVPWGQGFRDMAPALDAFEHSVLSRAFQHPGNPVLTWCISNAIAVSDAAGGRKLDKTKSRFRIDGAVAVAMAIGLKSRDAVIEEGPSIYEERGVVSF